MQRHSLSSKARHPAILGIAFLLCGCVALGVPRVARAREVEGLVAYLPFDEGAGATCADPRGTGHEGELLDDVAWGSGKYGGGLNFGGDGGYVRVPHHSDFDFTEGLTVAAWIRPTLDAGPGTWQIIAAKGQDAAEFFEILLNPAGFAWLGWQFAGGRVVPDQSPPSIQADEWQHIAVSYQIDEWWIIYLDGDALIEYPPENQELVPNADDIVLGVEEPLGLDRFYNGDMDEFALYDRGLTQEEVQEMMAGVGLLLPVDAEGMHPTRWGALKATYSQ